MSEQYYEGVGRRKRATARVRLYTSAGDLPAGQGAAGPGTGTGLGRDGDPPALGDSGLGSGSGLGSVGASAHTGLGQVIVNGKPAEDFFPRLGDLQQAVEPLQATGLTDSFLVSVLVRGGGITGQSSAVRQGLARALLKSDPALRPVLRKGGFLTRDARIKERKKPGLKRARKAPQYTKR